MLRLKTRRQGFCLCIPATLLLVSSVALLVLLLIFDEIFYSIVNKNLVLSPDSPTYDGWVNPKSQFFTSVYLFNLTNRDEVLAGGRPSLREVGPFVFRLSSERFDVQFGNGSLSSTVRFKQRNFYHFDRSKSVGDPKDVSIFTINLFYIGSLSYPIQIGQPFYETTVEDALWKKSIGLLSRANSSKPKEFVVDTGAKNIQNKGKVYEVDGSNSLDLWDFPEANLINATDAGLFPPGLDVGSTVSVHIPDICRSTMLYGVKRKRAINHEDIELVVFSATPPNSTDSSVLWHTHMFCTAEDGCPPTSMMALQKCFAKSGDSVPIFLSNPYFLGSDKLISSSFDGLPVPQEDLHSSFVHVEPTTGFVLEAFKRFQLNIYIERVNEDFKEMAGPYYFPIAWISENAIADKQTLQEFYESVIGLQKKLPIAIACLSAALCLSALFLYVTLFVGTRHSFKTSSDSSTELESGGQFDDRLNESLTHGTNSKDSDSTQI